MAQTANSSTNTTKSPLSRKTLKAQGRKKRKLRLQTDTAFAKTYFEGRSKRSSEKKLAYRKRHAKKTG